jgi:hypothetical protein
MAVRVETDPSAASADKGSTTLKVNWGSDQLSSEPFLSWHGVQRKSVWPIDRDRIADLGLPILVGPDHCLDCSKERFHLERDRIEFDTENGLPLTDPPDLAQAVRWS